MFKIIKALISIYKGKKYGNNLSSKGKILFISQDRQWGSINYRDNQRKTDIFFDNVITELNKENFRTIGIYPIDLYPIRGLKIFIKKLNYANFQHIPLNIYWDINAWKEEIIALRRFSKIWNKLEKNENLKNLLYFEKPNMDAIVIPELSIYFNILYPHLVKYIHIARKMIRSEKPNLIILLNEFFWWERSLLIAAKMEGVPTMAIQHGVIPQFSKAYMYTNDEIDLYGDFKSPFAPIPDMTLVDGPFYRDMLIKIGSYPANSVIATGQPRYDDLQKLIHSRSNFDYIRDEYNIPKNFKIILWTTQCHSLSYTENYRNFKCIVNTLKQLKNCVLIIKQHPAEGKRYTFLIRKFTKNIDLPILLVPKKSNIYPLIASCDLMITKNSTTVIEALLMKKQTIILNLSGKPDIVDYVTEGIAKGIYQESDLFPTIKEILENPSINEEKRIKYLSNHLGNFNGYATKNVVEEIKKMIKYRSDEF